MKECFRVKRFSAESLTRINAADEILTEYEDQGYRMTLRQLYYVFIGRDLFPDSWIDVEYNRKHNLPDDTKNTLKNYKRFGNIISEARLAGLLDWDVMEDRIRVPSSVQSFEGTADVARTFKAVVETYNLDRWEGQSEYVEVWVEKDALAGVLAPVAERHHVSLMVNRGYSSQSAMYDSARRFRDAESNGKHCVILYIGDHDPSGEDMVRDISDRMRMFNVDDLEVRKLALTIEQVRKYKLPPNPAKVTDPRAAPYIRKFGDRSWEVDALTPPQLNALINDAMAGIIKQVSLRAVLKQEEIDKKKLRLTLKKLE